MAKLEATLKDFKPASLFSVHVIESPSPWDLLSNRREGQILCNALTLIGMKSQYLLTVNKEALAESFRKIGKGQSSNLRPIPIIHISAHGSSRGISLTCGEFIEWNELEKVLTPLNSVLGGFLILSISSCESLGAVSMAFRESGDLPFSVLIGNRGKPTWSDTLVGFLTIYHLIGKGIRFDKAVEAAKGASGNQDFLIFFGSDVQEVWKKWLELLENFRKIFLNSFDLFKNKNEV